MECSGNGTEARLNRTITGAASRITYAHAGDTVTIIKRNLEMVLVQAQGGPFWVHENALDGEIQIEPEQVVQVVQRKAAVRNAIKKQEQGMLF